MVRSPPEVSHHPTKFDRHRDCGTGDIMVVVCQTNSEDHVIIDSAGESYDLANFGSSRNSGSEDTMVFVCHVTL